MIHIALRCRSNFINPQTQRLSLSDHRTEHQRPLIGLISNPHSRRNRSQLAAVEAIVANHPNILHRITEKASQAADALSEFAKNDVDIVAINGGDGTTTQVFAELLEHRPFDRLPTLILLPGGTTNMNVGDVGFRGRLCQAVRRMADWAGNGNGEIKRLSRPVLRVQGSVDGAVAYGMFFGTGTIIRGIEYCHQNVHSLGIKDELGPAIALLRTLWGMLRKDPRYAAPHSMHVALDTEQRGPEREVFLLLVSSLERLFLGIRPYWGGEQAPLHCTWIETPAPRLLYEFPSLLRGRPRVTATPRNGYFSHNAREIRLWMDGMFTLDGEMYRASTQTGPLVISNGGDLDFLRIDG